MAVQDEIIWEPPTRVWSDSQLGQFAVRHRREAWGDYERLWDWSVSDLTGFWQAVWREMDVIDHGHASAPVEYTSVEDAKWFEGARLNYAEHALRGNGRADDDVVVYSGSQTRPDEQWTLQHLRSQVAAIADGLRSLGVGAGDRVAAYMPNIPEAVAAFLATASIGAIWSSCAPEFGPSAVIDRWKQIKPKILLTIDGYRYGEKDIARADEVRSIREAIDFESVVILGYLASDASLAGALTWDEVFPETDGSDLHFEPVAFGHPLYILFSSGTTGLPKPIVHGHGGILLEHWKSLALHFDLGPNDTFFWVSTTGWMVWNFLVSGLLVGSTLTLFDGNPAYPGLDAMWDLAEVSGATIVGLSAPFIMSSRKAGLRPRTESRKLTRLRHVASTGSPLPAEGFRWVVDSFEGQVSVHSYSGGTDVCTAFLGGSPVHPVVAGRIACRMLGCKVEAFDERAHPVIGSLGELAITEPMPSMPVGFWGDHGDERLHDAYFSTYPGVWRHGDWVSIHSDRSCVISGRSDATLNRGGVRMGTAELYSVVEALDIVDDALVVHLEDDSGGMGELILFVVPSPQWRPTQDQLRECISDALRKAVSPRHVPDTFVPVPAVPRTLTGKKLEVPVKRLLRGEAVDSVVSVESLQDPRALDPFVSWIQTRR